MRKFIIGTLAAVVIIVLPVCKLNAQAVVTGIVADVQSHPLKSVTVHLLNTPIATLTDNEGHFSIAKLQPGNYTIELTAIGYANIAKNIAVTTGNNPPLQFQMQVASVQLETVIVTAEKKEELLQKLPAAITALSATQVNDYRLWNLKDLTAIVPNLYAGNPGDERNVTSIRGITTTSYDPSITTYIDGVNQFSLDTYIPQLTDVERIEVLRGPQGTLYGRNAMGGVINIITKKPTNYTTGFAEIDFGNYNQQRYTAGIRFPLVKDKLFVGITSMFSKRNGYYTNDYNNTSFDNQQQVSGNYYVKYLPGNNWSLTLNAKHQNNQSPGPFPLVNGVDEALNNPYHLSQNQIGKMKDNTLNASLSVTHKGAAIDFATQFAWQNNHRYYATPIDGDFSPADAVSVINDYGNHWNNVKVFTHEMKFSSTTSKNDLLSWTAGTYFFQQDVSNKQATHFGKDAGLLGVPDSNFSTISTTTGKNTGIALFGQFNYQITKKLVLIAGIRYDYENKKLQVEGEYQPDGAAPIVTTPDTAASVHYNAISPKIGLKYSLSEDNNLYLNYSRGYRTGGLTQLGSDPSQPPLYPYLPEYSNNIEAGIKNNFLHNRFRINAAAFLTYVNNAQVPTLVLPDAITVTKNTGRLVSKGVELEFAGNPIKGLQLGYNFGYTDATYKSLKISSNGQTVDLQGKHQLFTPDFTSLFTAQYEYTLNEKESIRVLGRLEWYYLGNHYFDFANTIKQSPYGLLNSRVGVSCKRLGVYFWARNITNRKYIEYAYDFGAVHLGNPAVYGITIAARF